MCFWSLHLIGSLVRWATGALWEIPPAVGGTQVQDGNAPCGLFELSANRKRRS
ncbi:hypothetical protein EYF80_067448 [Liparis tanakae]|uniref:Uncharacterized protein n=1 Tax=Liparis tanakae TaxID=230148 RepID=A0A4Z2E150_9TELE|nr:hypothetical protein EYF80_067448 [Liparis tanakae]